LICEENKMAKVVVKMKIMPTSPDVDLSTVENKIKKIIEDDGSQFHSVIKVPIAFGLIALEIIFLREESKGNIDDIEAEIGKLDDVESVDTLDVRREFG